MTTEVSEKAFVVEAPGNKDLQDAQMAYNIKMAELMRADKKLMSRTELQRYLRDHSIWTEEDENLSRLLQTQLRTMERKLAEGGIKLEEAKRLAIQMKYNRALLLALTNKKTDMDNITMEYVAENHRFKFLMTRCIKDQDGNPAIRSIGECDLRQDDPMLIDAAAKLNSIIYNYDSQFFDKLPENKWLKNFGFVNKDGMLSDPDGKPVSIDGKLVRDDGRYIDENGDLVDVDGNRVNEDGEFVVENPKPFLDESGNPIGAKPKKKSKKTTKKKKKKA